MAINGSGKNKSIIQCIIDRHNGFFQRSDRATMTRYVEDLCATSTKHKICNLPNSLHSTFAIAFSCDNQFMASTHGDHTIRICNVYTGDCVQTLTGHPRTPWTVTWHPEKKHILASGCLGGQIRVWDYPQGESVSYDIGNSTMISSIVFSPRITNFLFIATGNRLLLWDWREAAPSLSIETANAKERVRLIKFHPTGDFLLTGITNSKCMYEMLSHEATDNQGADAFSNLAISMQRSGNRAVRMLGNIYYKKFKSKTCKLQWWDIRTYRLPDLKNGKDSILVPNSVILNDMSCALTNSGDSLAAFVYDDSSAQISLALFSVASGSLGQCLFISRIGSNVVSVSISPLDRYIIIGFSYAAPHMYAALLYKITKTRNRNFPQSTSTPTSTINLDFIRRIVHHNYSYTNNTGLPVRTNIASWLPEVGAGLVYGTNNGHVILSHV